MSDLLASVVNLFSSLPPWESSAAALAIAYLVLAARENILCWYCALVSTAIYTILFWDVSLLMESALNVYYMAMAVYGWQQWKFGGAENEGLAITRLSLRSNGLIIIAIFSMTLVSGFLLSKYTSAAWPYVDSFTTWGSVITTILVAKKVLDNWLYWLVIDTISIPLYIDRGLYPTAVLFVLYIFIVIAGYLNWTRRMHAQ